MYKVRFVILLCLGIFASSSFAGELIQNKKLIKGKLKNGLTYYIYPNQMPKGEAVYRLFIKAGSVYEEDDQKGLAHFLEHMAFNGTTNFPDDKIIRYLESKGAKFGRDLNAHTSMNETVYKLQLPTNDPILIDSTLSILADWAGGISFDSIQIEKERGVILSEWLARTSPQQEAKQALLVELLNNSRYSKRLTIGDTAIIRNFPRQRILDYYNNWYHPAVMAIAVCGDVDPEKLEATITEKFSNIKVTPKKNIPNYTISEYKNVTVKQITHESLDNVVLYSLQLLPIYPAVKNENDYKKYLHRLILNRLLKARFNAHAFQNPPYKKAEISYSSFLNSNAILLGSVELAPEKIKTGIEEYLNESEQIYRYGFLSLEIEKEKKAYLNEMKRKAESKSPVQSISLMNEIYSDFYAGNKVISITDEYNLVKKYISTIDSTTIVKQLQKLRNVKKTHYMISAFDKVKNELPTDKELLSMLDKIQHSAILPYKKHLDIPTTLLPEDPQGGEIIKETKMDPINAIVYDLKNGSRVIFRRSAQEKQNIMLTGFRKGGLYGVDSSQYVSGLFAANVIPLSGAGEFSREALNHYMAGNSASMRFIIDKTRAGIAGQANLADKETLFQLLYLKWMYPRVDSATLEQSKQKSIENYRTANKTEEDIYYRELGYLLQPKTYVNRVMTDTIIENELNKDFMIPVFNHCFGSANGYTFILIADCEAEELRPYIEKYIGSLPNFPAKTVYTFTGNEIIGQSTDFIRNAGSSEKAKVMLVTLQDSLPQPLNLYSIKLDIAKSIVRTKLMKVLREDMGMVYSVGVSSGATLFPRPLSRTHISFATTPENAELLIEKCKEVFVELSTKPQSFAKELSDVKTGLIKDAALDIQKNSFWASFIRNTIFNNDNNWDYVNNYESYVNSINAEEIAHLIQKIYIDSPLIKSILYPKANSNSKK